MEAIELNNLSFQFQLTSPDGPLDSTWQRTINISADFQLVVGGRIFFSEAQFPVVELALQLEQWLDHVAEIPTEFVYTSLESEIPGIIRISSGQQGWHFSSAFSEFADGTSFTLEQVVVATEGYLKEVGDAVFAEYGFRLSDLRHP